MKIELTYTAPNGAAYTGTNHDGNYQKALADLLLSIWDGQWCPLLDCHLETCLATDDLDADLEWLCDYASVSRQWTSIRSRLDEDDIARVLDLVHDWSAQLELMQLQLDSHAL